MTTPSPADGLPPLPERYAMEIGARFNESGSVLTELIVEPTSQEWQYGDKRSLYTAEQMREYALAASLRLREWRPIATCPTGEEVLLWNQETGDMFFGFKTLDAPTEDAIVTGFPHTAGYADAWMPKPDEPEYETADDLARILEEGE